MEHYYYKVFDVAVDSPSASDACVYSGSGVSLNPDGDPDARWSYAGAAQSYITADVLQPEEGGYFVLDVSECGDCDPDGGGEEEEEEEEEEEGDGDGGEE